MMLYLLDANVLITADHTYYGIDQVPEFWDWILHQSRKNRIKIPVEIIEEIEAGNKSKDDRLIEWISKDDERNLKDLLLNEKITPKLIHKVINDGYAEGLTDNDVEQLGRDPFLIAYAMADADRCVVTTEVSKPSARRQNRKIPDVCKSLSIQCCNTFEMTRKLSFSTSWNRD